MLLPKIKSSAGLRLRVLAPLVCLVVIAAVAPAAEASPQVHIATKYYTVHGRTAQEIRRDLNKHGVRSSDGKTYDAHTRWYVQWRFDFRNEGSRCALRGVRTSVDVTYTLPRWVDGAKAPEELWNQWQRYMRNLKTHEDGHRDIGVAAAEEIDKALNGLEPAANCREAESKANALAQNIIDKFRSKENFYDLRTAHGMLQGATFP